MTQTTVGDTLVDVKDVSGPDPRRWKALGVIAIVLTGSIVQSFMEYGENVRYLAPLVPLTIYVVVAFVWRARFHFATRSMRKVARQK